VLCVTDGTSKRHVIPEISAYVGIGSACCVRSCMLLIRHVPALNAAGIIRVQIALISAKTRSLALHANPAECGMPQASATPEKI
jgi:hypothetical protein